MKYGKRVTSELATATEIIIKVNEEDIDWEEERREVYRIGQYKKKEKQGP